MLGLMLLPGASASAASPWWQVLTGSRPTNMWVATDNVQEIETESGVLFPGAEGVAAAIKVGGEAPIGCLGTGAVGGAFCPGATGFPPTESAEQLEELLEGAFGVPVEVTGGPVGGASFHIRVSGGAPPIVLEQIGTLGSVKATVVSPGGSGRLVIAVMNIGDATVDATETPVRVVDELPPGVNATFAEGFGGTQGRAGPTKCTVEAPALVACEFEGKLPPYEALEIEILASLVGDPPSVTGPGRIEVSGGGAPTSAAEQTVSVSDEPTPFGLEKFLSLSEEEGGAEAVQAGGHPFQFTTTVQANAGKVIAGAEGRQSNTIEQPDLPRNIDFSLPAGLVGNASVMPQCDMTTFLRVVETINECPDATAVGATSVAVVEHASLGFVRLPVPVFNLPPATGEPARFGFVAVGVPVVIDTSVDPNDRYRIVAHVRNISQVAQFLSSTLTLWGTPGDPRHDSARGWNCLSTVRDPEHVEEHPCVRPPALPETAFFRQPVTCAEPLDFDVTLEPWNVPLESVQKKSSFTSPPMSGCNKVPFNPTVGSAPTSKLAANPSGFDFRLEMPNAGLLNPDAIAAEGQAKRVEVTLPEGMTINPSEGEGLVGCTPEQLARETASSRPGEGCPEASKIGEVQVSTPLLKEEAHGALYVAAPHDNPFGSLVALYMVAKIPERGILIRQAGEVKPDPVTGRLTTVFDDLPQVPFTTFKLHFREGGRAPLVTPPSCDGDPSQPGNQPFTVLAKFTPWSAADPDNPDPSEVVTRTSQFTIERGVDGGPCPSGGLPPFHPGLSAGTINNAAGTYSPFNLRLTRTDGEQEFTHFSIKLPPGVIGKLAGIPICTDANIAAARARTGPNGGLEELEHPSCPQASEVGRTLVGAGVGGSLTYVPGKVYLAGAYKGAPLSIVAITAARVGPFDLGTVVVRDALRVNPETAEVFVDAANSDPIPHIIQGIQVHARDIRVYVDRPEFMLNPTSCERTSTASTVVGSGLDFGSASDDQPVTVTSPFQAADCASLKFKPRMSFTLKGGTRRGATPALRAVVEPRKGDANFAKAQVTLPHSVFLEQAHIRTVCTRVQFNAGGGNGEQCPKASIYGRARVVTALLDEPLTGPVFLRSSSHPLPDMVLALHADRINLDLVGRIDSGKGGTIRTTFDQVPDAPASKLVLEMQGGQKSLIVNSKNICRGKHRAIAALEAQNGFERTLHPIVHAKGCGGGKKKSKR